MKRKITFVLVVVLAVTVIGVSAAFAKDNGGLGQSSAIRSMFDAMRSWSQQAQASGEITKEEAKAWNDHFNYMEKYHNENGFAGGCGGIRNNNGTTGNQNYMPGFRGGMMGGFKK